MSEQPEKGAAGEDKPNAAKKAANKKAKAEGNTKAQGKGADGQGPNQKGAIQGKPNGGQAGGPPAAKGNPNAGARPNAAARGQKVSQPVSSARLKRRHWSVITSFFTYVILPVVVVAFYLWSYAQDQYASTVAFAVRTEEGGSALEILGGITALSGSSSSDTDILYQFLNSQKLVEDMDAAIDLRGMWSKPENDPIFSFNPEGTIEDLVNHWERFVVISYDDTAGLIEVRAKAFDPVDATLIAQTLFDKSSEMINGLSDIAREDAIRYAREELDAAVSLLQQAREDVTRFRNLNQLVDPSVNVNTQAGLMGSLEAQLAEALIELDMLPSGRSDDPRVTQAQLRIEVIQRRIDEERAKLGFGEAGDDEVYANLYGEYERLVVEREFAEQRFASTQLTYDAALGEARRQSRYLAAYVLPTKAESSRYPQRFSTTAICALFLILLWASVVLVLYAVKDRR